MYKLLLVFLCFFSSSYSLQTESEAEFFNELVQNNQKIQHQNEETYLISIEVYSSSRHSAKELRYTEQIIWENNPATDKYRIKDRIVSEIENHAIYWKNYQYDEEGHCLDVSLQEGEYSKDRIQETECYFEESLHNPRMEEEEIIDEITQRSYALKRCFHYFEEDAELIQASAMQTAGHVIIMKYAALKKFETLTEEPPSTIVDDEMHILPYPPFDKPSSKNPSVDKEKTTVVETCKQILANAAEIRESLSYDNYIKKEWDDALHQFFGLNFLKLTGYYQHDAESGSFGSNEEIDKIRITLINGILNIRNDLHLNLHQLSSSHGGAKIHFVFRPTKGWMSDLVDCSKVKAGFTSPQAHLLAKKWKELIQEMGGTEGGGKIIHYAHSIGGSDTNAAKKLLTPQELKMIHVTTIGSPTLISNEGFGSVINYVSKRDGVCLFDPTNYIGKLIYPDSKPNTKVVYLGTFQGVPFIEHTLAAQSYDDILNILGKQFQEEYKLAKAKEENGLKAE